MRATLQIRTEKLMYLFTITAKTTAENPDHGMVGEAYVNCWINQETLDLAEAVARNSISEENWEVIETEEVTIIEESDYEEGDPDLAYFQQAITDGEVFVFNVCPKYPVYHLTFEVDAPNEEKDVLARAWVVNECIEDEMNPMNPNFWSGDRVQQAITIVNEAIDEQGFKVGKLVSQRPCCREDSPGDAEYYDDAEEHGVCIAFVFDEDVAT